MTTLDGMEMFTFWRTSAVYRVRVALALKGLSAKERFTDLEAGDQRKPKFLAVNPMGAIPALTVPGHAPLTQSLAILEFLEETAPNPALLPPDPFGRARVRAIALMVAADTHPFVTPRVRGYLTARPGFDLADWKAWQAHWFTTGLQAVEKRLAEPETGQFCHGGSPTFADICLASIVVVMRVFQIEVPDIPKVQEIMARCEATPAFANADPSLQEGAPSRS